MNEVKSSEECRACLRKIDDGVRQELFQPWYTPWALAGALIADDLAKLADVEITEFDKHSKVICPQCFHCLSDACSFLITVQTSDCILRKRFENTITVNKVTEAGTSWPQPIQVNKNLNGNIEDSIEVEIKKEVLSEDENGSDHNMDQDWEPTMDIKIEPEEIVAPVPSNIQENGACSLMETNEEVVQQSSTSNSCEEYLDTTIKEEPLSDDEHEVAPDLPLDCLLCMKAFNSVTGLKAHVIAQHSYGTVKRKADNDPLPVTKEITNEFACAICRKSFVTRTDLMVHEAEHGKHACFVCDAKFNSFRQLSLHVARCRPRNVPSSEPASSYAEEQRRKIAQKIARRVMRDASNPFWLPHNEFVSRFRLTKDAFEELCREIMPKLPTTTKSTAIRDELKILAALAFYGHGTYQRGVAASYLHNMSQPTLSNCLEEVTNALNSREVLLKYINFPTHRERREDIMADFMDKHGFPGAIGCIDGTHLAIIRPVEEGHAYYNTNSYHSLNILAICDLQLNILYVDASHGGDAHDNYIWDGLPVKPFMERLHLEGEKCWLLGDSGYAQKPYMMTPIYKAAYGSPEEFYNTVHRSTHSVVERCFRVLKARWRCLLSHRALHYTPIKAGKIVNACVVLHNIANAHKAPIPRLTDADCKPIQRSQHEFQIGLNDKCLTRNKLVHRLWAARPPIRPQQLSQSNNDPSAVEIKVEPQIGPSIEESQMEPVKKQRKLEPSIEENKVEYVQRQSKCVPSIDETEVELVQKQPNTETSIKHTKEESVQKHSKTGTSIEDSTVATVIKQPKLDPSIEETKVESDHKQSKNGKTIEETNVKPLQKESGNGHSIVEIQVEPIGKEFKNGLSFAETEVEPTQKQSNDGHSIEEMEPVENEFKNGLSVAQTEADPVQKQSNNGTSIVEIEVETVEKQFENGPSIVERGPDQNQSNNGPSTEESKMESVQEQSNNGHSIEETKVEPVQKQSNISHSIEESKVEPVQKQSNNGHSIEEIKVEPVQEQSNNGHSIEETKVEPVQEQSNNEPSKEETNVESVQKQSKIRPSIEETKDELVQTQSEIETSTTENAFEKQPKNEPSTEENKVEPSQDHHISPDQITEDQLKTIIPVSESITSDTLQNQIVNEHKSSDCESKTSELVSDELNNSFDSLQSSQDVLDKIFLNTPHKEHLPIESRHRIESELCLEEHTNRDNFSSTQNDDGNLNTPEETIPNKDEINQSMKVHFAINPLSEDPELLEHKMDIDIESGKSDGCEPNVVNMTGDNSVTQ